MTEMKHLPLHRQIWTALILALSLLIAEAQPIAAAPPKPNNQDSATTNTSRASILIQAENENTARVNSLASHEELEASYRQGYTGRGDWYLSTGGDTLTYQFSIDTAGTYALWVREWNDDRNTPGARAITILIDEVSIGTFPENTNRDSAFHWHKVANVPLSRDRHSMSVMKTQSTEGAAVIDAFQWIRVN